MAFQKGKITNPIGINGKRPVSEAIRALLSRPATDALTDKPKTIAQQIALNLVRKATFQDDRDAIREVIDRTEGKAAQAIIGDIDNPLAITIGKLAWKKD